ncbi:hypothetical protein M440DRAFT_1118784 [Trichoderma longibrachiatum ATCC 18648]|uniref:Uncharacterized protein n=1 Tax=Trichoderma longibrachiatum ATCC 18648 TaxID=983965 RepID=A0A2T4CF70_TRILO|nr:hypothetical protein M440DRAFT_1118784 [Trichoderma longibrachiatum ATCC 18648]
MLGQTENSAPRLTPASQQHLNNAKSTKFTSSRRIHRIGSSSHPGQAPVCNEKGKETDTPVRRPSTPTLPACHEGKQQTGSRSSREKTTLYTAAARGNRRHPCGQSERTGNIHSWVLRICNHQPGWIRWLFWEPKRETNTIEMILL